MEDIEKLEDLQETKPLRETTDTSKPPIDSYKLIYAALIFHGFGILIPWNMFISSTSYFQDIKLNVTFPNDTVSTDKLTHLRTNFLNYICGSAQAANLICNALNIMVRSKPSSLGPRITTSLIIECIFVLFNIVLAVVDSSEWPFTFFYLTMFSISVIYAATGVYQNCIYGIACVMPMKYSNAVVIGSNVCGTVATIILIISLAISPDAQKATILYFLIALFILMACLISYFSFNKSEFYRYYTRDLSESKVEEKRPPLLPIFKRIWPQCFNVFFTFFVTLALFPNVVSNIKKSNSFGLSETFFTPVACFLAFNTSALIGNLIPNYKIWPTPDKLWIVVVSRLAFMPFFMFCNYLPNVREWIVLFPNDVIFFLGSCAFGLTQGHASSMSLMYACQQSEPAHASYAGMIAAFFLVLGLFVGVNSSFFLTWIIQQKII